MPQFSLCETGRLCSLPGLIQVGHTAQEKWAPPPQGSCRRGLAPQPCCSGRPALCVPGSCGRDKGRVLSGQHLDFTVGKWTFWNPQGRAGKQGDPSAVLCERQCMEQGHGNPLQAPGPRPRAKSRALSGKGDGSQVHGIPRQKLCGWTDWQWEFQAAYSSRSFSGARLVAGDFRRLGLPRPKATPSPRATRARTWMQK